MSNALNDWNPLSIRLVSFSRLAPLLMALIVGCGGQDASKTAAKCAESDLVAQCPPGTTPELETGHGCKSEQLHELAHSSSNGSSKNVPSPI